MLVANRTALLWAPGNLFDCRRLLLFCKVLLALEIITFLFFVAGTHGMIVPLAKPVSPPQPSDLKRYLAEAARAQAAQEWPA